MKKLGIITTDGVGFRNFMLSNFMEEVSQQFNAVVIYSRLSKIPIKISCCHIITNHQKQFREL